MTETKHARDTRRFYIEALSEAEAQDFSEALKVEGVEQEIAFLRLRLRTALEKQPEDLQLMLRGMDILRRLVASRYGLKQADRKQLSSFAEETHRRLIERAGGGGK